MQGARLSEPLRHSAAPYGAEVWRIVEAQHHVSTLKLTDTLAEQALLETMLDETKPTLPQECAGLEYLLAAPFRYAPYPFGSRFRRAGRTSGVYYAAEMVETAIAETAFYRLLFFSESPSILFPDAPTDFSAFSTDVKTSHALDLTSPNFANSALSDLTDYSACQTLADKAREENIELLRYASVRDPKRGCNVAVLTPQCFVDKTSRQHQTWRIKIGQGGVSALCEFPLRRLSFAPESFAADPRLTNFNWLR
jgi:RES domain